MIYSFVLVVWKKLNEMDLSNHVRIPSTKVCHAVSLAALSHKLGFAGLARISSFPRLSPHATHALLNESRWMFQGRSP